MKIRLEATSQDAESREAQVSNLLTSGNQDVDLIAINDEMASEYIPKGYLEPLGEDVLSEGIRSSFSEEYFQKVCMYEGGGILRAVHAGHHDVLDKPEVSGRGWGF